MTISDLIEDFAVKYYNSRTIKRIFAPIYRWWIKHNSKSNIITKLKDNYDKNGISVLKKFDEIMTSINTPYVLAFGTMLGAIREKGFIKHDLDIDVIIWYEDYTPELIETLKKYGFRLTHQFSIENDTLGKEDTIELNGVQIDIFYYYPPLTKGRNPYCCDFPIFADTRSRRQSIRKHGGLQPRRLEIPLSRDIKRVPFESLYLPIPLNAVEFLTKRYGDDFMTPNPNWENNNTDYIIVWNGKTAKYAEF